MRLKRLQFVLAIIVALTLGNSISVPQVHAQAVSEFVSGVLNTIAPGVGGTAAIALSQTPVGEKMDAGSCSLLNFNIEGCTATLFAYIFNNILLPIVAEMMALCAVILNGVMLLTFGMSSFVNGAGSVVDGTWSVIRDLASIIIIFFLLYVSINMILGRDKSTLRHIIVMTVIAGVLLNFSLFLTKTAIDASNLVGLSFYQAISPGVIPNANSATTGGYISSAFSSGQGLANTVENALQIQNVSSYRTGNTSAIIIIQNALYAMALMLVTSFIFIAAALLMVIRIGMLIVLLVFSPFYFIGFIVPHVEEKISKPWFDMLMNQLLILPIFMFFMYVAMRVISNPVFQNTNDALTSTAGGTTLFSLATVGTFMKYAIDITLLCIALMAAMKYASVGKDTVNSMIKGGKKWAGSTAAFAPRNTFGLVANRVGQSEGFRKFAASNPIVGGIASKGLKNISSASFGGKKGGYDKAVEEREKARKGVFKQIGTVDRASFQNGPEGDKQFKEAQRKALSAQKTYIEQMRKQTLTNFLLSTRKTAHALDKDYNAAHGKEYGKELNAANAFEEADLKHTVRIQESNRKAIKTSIGMREEEAKNKIVAQETQIKGFHSERKNQNQEQLKTRLETVENQKKANATKMEQTRIELERQRVQNDEKIKDFEKKIIENSTLVGETNPKKSAARAEFQGKIAALRTTNVSIEPQLKSLELQTKSENEKLEDDAKKIKEHHENEDKNIEAQTTKDLSEMRDRVNAEKLGKMIDISVAGAKEDEKMIAAIKQKEEMNKKNAESRAKYLKSAEAAASAESLRRAVKEVNEENEPAPKEDKGSGDGEGKDKK